jgi:transcriptional regulator with XRE-family HTH domain
MIGLRLKSARSAAGMTQSALAAATGISQSHISQMESGDREPSMDAIRMLAQGLGVAPAYLVGDAAHGVSADFLADPRSAIRDDPESPPGLRDLAADTALTEILMVRPAEWAMLRSLAAPSPPSKNGYLVLLHVLRAICPA